MESNFDAILDQAIEEAKQGEFKPCGIYNEDGDTLEVYLCNENGIVERVDSLFSIFVDPADRDRVLGFAIKNIRKHFGDSGLTSVVFETSHKTVRLILLGALLSQEIILTRKAPEDRPHGLPQRMTELLNAFGDTPLELENMECLTA